MKGLQEHFNMLQQANSELKHSATLSMTEDDDLFVEDKDRAKAQLAHHMVLIQKTHLKRQQQVEEHRLRTLTAEKTRVQEATVAREIFLEEAQRELPMEVQLANIRNTVAKIAQGSRSSNRSHSQVKRNSHSRIESPSRSHMRLESPRRSHMRLGSPRRSRSTRIGSSPGRSTQNRQSRPKNGSGRGTRGPSTISRGGSSSKSGSSWSSRSNQWQGHGSATGRQGRQQARGNSRGKGKGSSRPRSGSNSWRSRGSQDRSRSRGKGRGKGKGNLRGKGKGKGRGKAGWKKSSETWWPPPWSRGAWGQG